MEVAALVLVVVGVGVVTMAAAYNAVASLRQDVRDAWTAMDAALRRRAELLPPLVSAARSTGEPTPPALADAVAARNRAAVAIDAGALAAAESDLSSHLRTLFASPPPRLADHPAFAECRSSLTAADAAIAAAGRQYEAAVGSYNAARASFPTSWAAVAFGFGRQSPFGVR